MSDPFERAAARERADRDLRAENLRYRGTRLAFRVHLSVYVMVQALLFATWLTLRMNGQPNEHPWFIYPLLGWGIALAAHYAVTREITGAGRGR